MTEPPPEYAVSGTISSLRREAGAFLLLATVLSWAVMIPVWHGLPGDFQPGDQEALQRAFGSWMMLFGAGPMIAAIIMTAVMRGPRALAALFARVVRVRVGLHWFAIALFLPLLPQWIALWSWSQLTGHPIRWDALDGYVVSWLQIAVVSSAFFITEELGWRGFLLPRVLVGRSWLVAGLGVGVIWAVWHYPYWLTSTWGTVGDWPVTITIAMGSTVRAVALSVLLTWIFRATRGSVLLAMIFHGANNANFDKMFAAAGDAAIDGPVYMLLQGLGAALVATVVAAVVVRGARRSPSVPQPAD